MFRIGLGYDIHKLVPGGPLMLAGVEIDCALSPEAHSDGDVALHALTDALLGAVADGDIGEHFPDTDPRWASQPSRVFLSEASRIVADKGFRLVNCDLTILTQQPRLEPHKPALAASLADLLDLPQDRISVKAKTNEGLDAVGQGLAIACHAIVLLEISPEGGVSRAS